jgi:cytochrome oxidase Cu insertion factor (SCO1/SenC/PrrC family)
MIKIAGVAILLVMGALFSLRASGGLPIASAREAPRWLVSSSTETLVVFGYVDCDAECPLTLQHLTDAATKKPPSERPAIVFVDVDPWHDDEPRVHAFVHHFNGVRGVRPNLQMLVATESALGAHVVMQPADVPEHDARVFVIDRAGFVSATLPPK